jgi:multidrug efflux pump subunit AcrB
MEFKTSYENALVAFNNYTKGFKGKIKLEDVKTTREVFSKIFDKLKGLDEAYNIKMEVHNQWTKDNPQLTVKEKQEAAEKINKEYGEVRKSVMFEITADQKEAMLKTLNAVEWTEEERPTSGELECFCKFIDDLETINF